MFLRDVLGSFWCFAAIAADGSAKQGRKAARWVCPRHPAPCGPSSTAKRGRACRFRKHFPYLPRAFRELSRAGIVRKAREGVYFGGTPRFAARPGGVAEKVLQRAASQGRPVTPSPCCRGSANDHRRDHRPGRARRAFAHRGSSPCAGRSSASGTSTGPRR